MANENYVDYGNDDGQIMGRSSGKIGFYGTTPVVQAATQAAGTDLATTQALANAIRTALINLGVIAAS